MKRMTKKLASTTLALLLGSQPLFQATDVFASNTSIPKLTLVRIEEGDNEFPSQVYLNWDIEVPANEVFSTEDFEDVYFDLSNYTLVNSNVYENGHYYDYEGNIRPANDPVRNSLKVTDGIGYNSNRGIIAKDSINNGYSYTYFLDGTYDKIGDSSNILITQFNKVLGDRQAIARFKAKGNASLSIYLESAWYGKSVVAQGLTYNENLSVSQLKNRVSNGSNK